MVEEQKLDLNAGYITSDVYAAFEEALTKCFPGFKLPDGEPHLRLEMGMLYMARWDKFQALIEEVMKEAIEADPNNLAVVEKAQREIRAQRLRKQLVRRNT